MYVRCGDKLQSSVCMFAYPDIRYPDIRIYPLILWQPKSGYLKVKIRLLWLFAKIV